MACYLYGAAVQGIQDFILSTNELQDIVGASELVDAICTSDFDEFCDGKEDDKHSIVRAAGNIKYIFTDKPSCEKAVHDFPRKILKKAPGITISQAVVTLKNDYSKEDFAKAIDCLESRLRCQRNKPMRSMTLGLMGLRRSRKTGLPAIKEKDGDYLDDASLKKRKDRKNSTMKVCEKAFNIDNGEKSKEKIAFNIKDLTGKNDWIAIIHADGNGLGQVIKNIGDDMAKFREFSIKLDEATRDAAVKAYEEVIQPKMISENLAVIPVRPVVLSGDDFTALVRGDLAIEYVKAFLAFFEIQTMEKLNKIPGLKNGLTACAGISFIKSSYPFYYGYNLAESLCSKAKKKSKTIDECMPPSCLMFHKVQDSFMEDYDNVVKRELTPARGHSFEFGPYFLKDQPGYWKIDDLFKRVYLLDKDDNTVKSHLRQWMTLMHNKDKGIDQAKQKSKRLLSLLDLKEDLQGMIKEILGEERKYKTTEGDIKYPVYDILSLHSIINQVTK